MANDALSSGDSQAYGAGSIPVIRSIAKPQVNDLGLLLFGETLLSYFALRT
ncbi:hypothetical protein [Streptomyces sp. NPDC058583]|uniref:hypothetical protein n=1 Tax=unclassified Streptomyces TaxID=2593676 RepID=UPI00365C1247